MIGSWRRGHVVNHPVNPFPSLKLRLIHSTDLHKNSSLSGMDELPKLVRHSEGGTRLLAIGVGYGYEISVPTHDHCDLPFSVQVSTDIQQLVLIPVQKNLLEPVSYRRYVVFAFVSRVRINLAID